MSDPHRQDAAARRRAQTEFVRPIALQAGAGTGKTTTLVARILSWCLERGWQRAQRVDDDRATDRASDPHAVANRVLEGVVAITFTEAAAAEMESRVASALAVLAAGGWPAGLDPAVLGTPEPILRDRAAALSGALDRLVVRTIHAFCRRLLSAYPLEAGLDPSFEIDADGSRLEALTVQLLEGRLATAYADPVDADYLTLAHASIGPQQLAEAVIALVQEGVPADALAAAPFARSRVDRAVAELASAIDAFRRIERDRLLDARRSPAAVRAVHGIARLRLKLESIDGDVSVLVSAAQAVVDRAGERLRDFARGRFNPTELSAIGADAAAIANASDELDRRLRAIAAVEPELLDTLRRTLLPLVTDVRTALRGQGVETFGALLTDARDLLRTHPEVLARIRRGIDQLLVDEFQDTDRVQCEILAALAFGSPSSADANDNDDRNDSRGSDRDPTGPALFLVGDPKQSIYGWRNADLLAYDEFIADVLNRGGELHALTVNFRSVPAILAEVERVVAPVMHREHGLQPAFEPLVPSPERAAAPGHVDDQRAPVEHWVSWAWDEGATAPRTTGARQAAEIEATHLARDIAALHRDQGVAFGRIGVLLRSTGDLDVYVRALRDRQIPYTVSRDRSYYRRREIIEAAAMVRACLDPNDQVALVTWLRSATIGVPDAALIPLWERELPRRMAELGGAGSAAVAAVADDGAVADGAAAAVADLARAIARQPTPGVPGLERVAGWEENLALAAHAIAALRRSFVTDPPDEFVERLRRATAIEASEAGRYLGRYRLANLERFFRDLLTALEQGAGDRVAVLRSLRRAIAEGRDGEEGRPLDAADDAVQLMTIHQAKGLDFDHVYLVQMHKRTAREGPRTTRTEPVADHWEMSLLGATTLGYHAVRQRSRQVEAAERVRTLYVALTRARERLVMLANWPRHDPAPADSYSALLDTRAAPVPDLAALMTSVSAARPVATASDALWVFPARASDLEAPPLEPPPLEPGETTLAAARPRRSIDAVDLARSAAELATRQQRARAHSARPWSAAASGSSRDAPLTEPAATGARSEEDIASDSASDLATTGGDRTRTEATRADLARAVGTAVHRLFERIDLQVADPASELVRLRALAGAELGRELAPPAAAEAARRLDRILDRLQRSHILTRLRELAPHILARELPFLAPPDPTDPLAPCGYVSGAIDLVYRDPESGEIVVADYKTDAVDGALDVLERSRRYAAQGRAYAEAVRSALALDRSPRFELWFVRADHIESVELDRRAGPDRGGRVSGRPDPNRTAPRRQPSLFD